MIEIQSDFLVIGSGIAGLSLAIKLSELGTVSVVSKRDYLAGSTAHAQGGIAAGFSPEDSFEQHVQDTLRAGAGLCHEEVVRGVVQEGPARIKELIDWGMSFTRDAHDKDHPFELGLEGGHSQRRILHAGDYTGAEIAKTLLKNAQSHPKIKFYEYYIAIDLITTEELGDREPHTCLGAYVLDIRKQQIVTFL